MGEQTGRHFAFFCSTLFGSGGGADLVSTPINLGSFGGAAFIPCAVVFLGFSSDMSISPTWF
jgi:hypothetical protein